MPMMPVTFFVLRPVGRDNKNIPKGSPSGDTGVCSCLHDYHFFSSAVCGAGKRWYQVAVREGNGGLTAQ